MTEVLVYAQHSTTRLQYTFHWVFVERLGLDLIITNDIEAFENVSEIKINYSNQTLTNCLNIDSSSLLYDSSINENFGEIGEWNGIKTIFKSTSTAVPFDIFSAIFYCISRMEEYGVNPTDMHGRFTPNNSVLSKLNVLHLPIVDLWLEEFKKVLLIQFPTLEFKKEEFQWINTFDVDQAFCFKGKGLMRNAGGVVKDLLRLNFKQAIERMKVLLGMKRDPFDTFDYIIAQHKEHNLTTIVFLLLADYGTYDKNVSINDTRFIERINRLLEELSLGIHPSYNSFNDPAILSKEIKRLVTLQQKPVSESRQHYLRFQLPITFRLLVEAGIRHDYSLGYAEAPGFRAGTSHPFQWFDMERNEVSLLTIHPSCIMDVTLKNYMKLEPKEAIKEIEKLKQSVKLVNGTFISIWHNESISNYGEWEGWREVYESMLRR